MIRLNFTEEAEEYIRLVCTRKGVSLEDYIISNLEWDNKPDCLYPDTVREIPKGMCYGCEYAGKCPDVKE